MREWETPQLKPVSSMKQKKKSSVAKKPETQNHVQKYCSSLSVLWSMKLLGRRLSGFRFPGVFMWAWHCHPHRFPRQGPGPQLNTAVGHAGAPSCQPQGPEPTPGHEASRAHQSVHKHSSPHVRAADLGGRERVRQVSAFPSSKSPNLNLPALQRVQLLWPILSFSQARLTGLILVQHRPCHHVDLEGTCDRTLWSPV